MATADEVYKMNEAIFAKLSEPSEFAENAATAVCQYTRSLMYHRFTGMPKRGFFRRICPVLPVKTREEWLAIGVRPEHLVTYDAHGPKGTLVEGVQPAWESGDVFYEIAENRLDREDYERRLAARKVEKWEWYSRQRSRRRVAYYNRLSNEKMFTGEQREVFAYNLMGEILGMTLALAERNDRGNRNEDQAGTDQR